MTAVETSRTADGTAVLEHLLLRTSRTFALVIPRLPSPTREAVTLAYLLLRLADTVEDSATWPVSQRQAALDSLATALDAHPGHIETLAATWLRDAVTDDEGCRELLEHAGELMRAVHGLSPQRRAVVLEHVIRSVRGMREMLNHAMPRGHELTSLTELKAYCYVVAGLVGELLTALFRIDVPSLEGVAAQLEDRAVAFGEGLQLVNILKDAEADAAEGRRFLPPAVERSAVFELARADLQLAREYVNALATGGAPVGLLTFTLLPVELAVATLDVVETRGAGAKLSRDEVFAIVARVDATLEPTTP
ncbi:MAG: squalene/phytoene synthase family protein [Myxococcaceae bacterium]|nr:squalene/phytoene synthase family protein [Myxococcaceae bacterium]